MSADQFVVVTAALRAVANRFGDRADDAAAVADRARSAEVGARSWGLLGLSLGLYAGYTSARSTAEHSITQVQAFLTDAKGALQSTARDYDQADEACGQVFDTIGRTMAGGGAS